MSGGDDDDAPREPEAARAILEGLDRFDAVIDVRSPAEFAEDHLPGAINLPALSDAERAEVGTIYVRDCRFRARKIGAAYMSRNIAAHLSGPLAETPGAWRPLLYCWRGGQRSGAFAIVLRQIGWSVETLPGGYRSYRRRVTRRLYHDAPWFRLVALEGVTGVGKTALLARLAARGRSTLDLEAAANHRGSIFGGVGLGPQPSQKAFESRLLLGLEAAATRGPLLVEAESSKIGERMTPPTLWKAMGAAPAIEVRATPAARARHIVRAYGEIVADPTRLDALLTSLTPRHGHATIAAWRALAAEGAVEDLAAALMAEHYDPAYARSTAAHARPRLGLVELDPSDEADLDRAADAVEALLDRA